LKELIMKNDVENILKKATSSERREMTVKRIGV